MMIKADALTHYVVINPVPHSNAYYAYTTLYEHWIANIELAETSSRITEQIYKQKNITKCHLYSLKHKPRTSHAPWINGLVEGMNFSPQNQSDAL